MEMHSQKVQGMSMQNANTQKETRDHQNSRNELEKGHSMPKSANDEGALAAMCGRDKELENNNA
jgi:hypothetical protein